MRPRNCRVRPSCPDSACAWSGCSSHDTGSHTPTRLALAHKTHEPGTRKGQGSRMTRRRPEPRPNLQTGGDLSSLACAVYEILRQRVGQADPRITYKELACLLRETDTAFEHVTHRSQELYASLWEVGDICRDLVLPPLPALVVRADTRRPGDAYFVGSSLVHRGERIAAWQRDLDAVFQATYPSIP